MNAVSKKNVLASLNVIHSIILQYILCGRDLEYGAVIGRGKSDKTLERMSSYLSSLLSSTNMLISWNHKKKKITF